MRIMILKKNMMIKTKQKYIKTEVIYFGFFMIIGVILTNCNSKELSAKEIIFKSVEAHGGIDLWNNVKQLSFDKETTLFLEDGSVEIKTDQFQLFRFQPSLFGKIEWEDDANDFVLTYDDNKISKSINDSIITLETELAKAENSFFAAQYVIMQPFALLEDKVQLTLNGVEIIEEKKVYSISVKYENDTDDSNKWTYFIDANTFEVLYNKVELSDHTSWVENLTFNTESEFKFNAHRKSYRLNDAGEKTYLRAEYFYSNFEVYFK